MSSKNYSDKILDSIEITIQSALNKLNYDVTVQAIIEQIVNLDVGEYKVKYNGNIFSAFANDLSYTYDVGDNIYLKIPEGNFSNKKFIENKVNNKSLSENDYTSLENSISPVGPTWNTFYNYSMDAVGVIAGAPVGDLDSEEYIFQWDEDKGFHDPFLQYANNYELIRIQAEFKTNLYNKHTKGNYGIELTFFTKNNEDVNYRLEIGAFNGNPYELNVFTKQEVIVEAQKNYLTGLKSIRLFEEDFEYDRYIVNGEVGDQNTEKENIFVKNIKIDYVERKNLLDNLYYLRIKTPKGKLFTDKITDLTLEGELIYNGQSILTKDNSVCRWFERDFSVMIGHEAYDKNAGFGWREIKSDFNILAINKKQVLYEKEYKLLVTYNNNVIMSEEIMVSNNDTIYDCGIAQITEGDDIKLVIENYKDDKELVGEWYYSLPDGSYRPFSADKLNTIEVKDFLLYSSVTFYCSIYDEDILIATRLHTIVNSSSQEDLTITYVGEDSFRYDANGDITIEDSEKERTIECKLAWKEGYGTSYTLKWISPDGSELIPGAAGVDPEDSMISNLWVDNYNILHYTIKQKYRVNYNNNTITIKIITLNEVEYTFKKEILFVKDGDQGTNGTTYIMAIRPCDDNEIKLSGFNALTYRNNRWQDYLKLKGYIYKDGELINDQTDKYSFTYKWAAVNLRITEGLGSDLIRIVGASAPTSNNSANLEYYVKLQVDIKDDINDEKTSLYAFYPIDIIVGSLNKDLVDITDIPSYVKYTSSGTNPSFYSNNLTCLYNDIDYTADIVSMNEDVLKINDLDSGRYLSPASKFFFEAKNNTSSDIGVLKCQIENNYIIHSIIMYLDTYGNEAINSWDGTSVSGTFALDENSSITLNRQYYQKLSNGTFSTISLNSSTYKPNTYYYQTSIFAPQMGAGEKDSQNRFSGVVMGKDSGQRQIGLYGYENGVNTFGLMQNGKAYFGASGNGRINIDGTSAIIYGGLNKGGANSMIITLNTDGMSSSTKAIDIRGNKAKSIFNVDYRGNLYAEGEITATYLTATQGGEIADFTFDDEGMEGGSIQCDYLEANVSGQIADFSIDSDGLRGGSIYCDYLKANEKGEIAGWKISSETLKKGNTILDGSNGEITTDTFKISNLGYIGEITGNDGHSSTTCVGISSNRSVVLESGRNIAFRPDGNIYIGGEDIYLQIDAENQHGIYARFA